MSTGAVLPRLHGLSAGDQEVLLAWAHAGKPRLARRAWIILQECAGVSERSLAKATPLSSARVQALVAGYRRQGLLGILDQPRSGRPESGLTGQIEQTLAASSAAISALEKTLNAESIHPGRRDTVWRLARGQGVNLERLRRRQINWPGIVDGPWARVLAVGVGPGVSVVIIGATVPGSRPTGIWLHPRLNALPASILQNTLDWTTALKVLSTQNIGPDAPRAVTERRRRLIESLTLRVQRERSIDVLVGGDALSDEYLGWLTAIRALQRQATASGQSLHVRGATTLDAWKQQVSAVFSGDPSTDSLSNGNPMQIAGLLWRPSMHFWWVRHVTQSSDRERPDLPR